MKEAFLYKEWKITEQSPDGNRIVLERVTNSTPVDPDAFAVPTGTLEALPVSETIAAVVVDPTEQVVAAIDALSGGEYRRKLTEWAESNTEGNRPKWRLLREIAAMRETHWTAARETVERPLLDIANWTVNGEAPARVWGVPIGVGGGNDAIGDVDYRWCIYVERAQPTETWAVSLTTEKISGTVTWNQADVVSRAIKVNQVGYLSGANKIAYFGQYLWPESLTLDATEFSVIDASTGTPAWTGHPTVAADQVTGERNDRLMSGETVYTLDFSAFAPQQNGWYYLRIPGVGRSWPFRIGDGSYVFGEAYYTVARGLLHQRCGQALTPDLTAWTRPADPHHARIYETEHIRTGYGPEGIQTPQTWNRIRFDIIGGTLDTTRVTENVIGDWHDAADWDRSVQHYKVIYDLLYTAELGASTDGQWGIPESGNGLPDALDEALWGMEAWIRSMNSEGGASSMIEAHTHPPFLADVKYGFAQRDQWSSLALAAGAAHASRLLAEHGDSEQSAKYRDIAERAFAFGVDPENVLDVSVEARKERGEGEPYTATYQQTPDQTWPYEIHARCQLYLLTRDEKYLEGLDALLQEMGNRKRFPSHHEYGATSHHHWTAYEIATGAVPSAHTEWVREKWYREPADRLVSMLDAGGYQITWPLGDARLGWGNGAFLNQSEVLLVAHRLFGDDKYREAALRNVEYAFGANPMGMSWTTGVGWAYPAVLQHAPSEDDGIADPVPGITIYGPTGGGYYRALARDIWAGFWQPTDGVPILRSWSPHPSLSVAANEFTVHQTMGSPVFVLGQLIGAGWQPDAALKARGPKPVDELYGRVFLP